MATLNQYFTNSIGRTIRNAVTTGHVSFVEIYERAFAAEVVALEDDNVFVYVTSYDVGPSGARLGNTEQRLGDQVVSIAGCHTLTEFWQRLIRQADPAFAAKYGANTLKRSN